MNPTTTGSQIIHCRSCEAANRVPIDKLREGGEPVCGRCKTALAVREPVALTDATFVSEVEKSALPVLVDLWAEWCGPCRMIAPAIEQLAAEFAGRLRVGKLNIDQNPATTERFRVQGIPLLLLFKHGREVERIVGAVPKSEIVRRMRSWIE